MMVSCTSLGGIDIRMLFLGFCNPSEYIYIIEIHAVIYTKKLTPLQ
jgi:hypothetical protein